VKHLGWLSALALAPLVIANPAQAQFKALEGYLDWLGGSAESVAGPSTAVIERTIGDPATTKVIPVNELRAILSQCRTAGGGGGGAVEYPNRFVVYRYFECLQADAPDKSAKVVLFVGPEYRIDEVHVLLGDKIGWPPAAPSGPAWKQWDKARYDQYRAKSLDFIGLLNSDASLARDALPSRIELYSDTERGASISVDRLRKVVHGCTPGYSVAAKVPAKDGGEPREGLRTLLKCDPRSSAPSDLTLYAAFTNSSIDTVLISTDFGYRLPPTAAEARKQ
jgi:hypothetical protein